jgi:hypothetical protein
MDLDLALELDLMGLEIYITGPGTRPEVLTKINK